MEERVYLPQLQAPCAQPQSAQVHPAVPQPGILRDGLVLVLGLVLGRRKEVNCVRCFGLLWCESVAVV